MTERHHSPKEDRSRDWCRMGDTVWNVASDSSLPLIHPPSKLLNVTKDSINSLGSQTELPLAHQLCTQFKPCGPFYITCYLSGSLSKTYLWSQRHAVTC